MSQYENFTSLPPEKEREFVVFEKTSVEASKKALRIGMITSGIFGLLVVLVVMSFEEPENKMAGDDMGMLKSSTKADKKDEAPKPDKKPAAAAESDEAAAKDGEAPAEAPSEGE